MRRLLWILLRLYPRGHRQAYGQEMVEAAEYRWQRSRGFLWPAAVAAADMVFGAVGVWWDRGRKMMRGMGRGWGLDARFLGRSLWRSRGYAATTVMVLACAVAANATVFSFVRGTLLSPPPYPDPDEVVVVWGSNVVDGQLRDVISGPAYIHLTEETSTFQRMAAMHHDATYLEVDGRPEVLDAMEVSADFFRVLEVQPALGRLFGEEERMSGGAETVVVTHAFWRDRLASDPAALGTSLPFEGNPRTIVGVLPEGFEFLSPAPVFLPLHDDVLAADDPGRIHFNALARLAPDVTLADASADLARAAGTFVADYPGFEGWGFLAEPLHRVSVAAVRPVILTLAATVVLVLLVALVNLATLFRIRSLARGDELSVRLALGAGWGRVARILSMETVFLAGLGATLGLAATPFLLGRVTEVLPAWIPIPESASRAPVLQAVLDPAVVAVAFAAAVLGALILTAPGLAAALKEGRPSKTHRVHGGLRGTRLMVGMELAMATALCVGAGLMVRSADKLLGTDVGMEHEGMMTLYYGDTWGMEVDQRVSYLRETVEAVEAIPGVRRAGVTGYVDFQAEDDFARIYFLDRSFQPVRDVREEWRRVDDGLFEAAGMRILAGRGFQPDDFVGTPRTAIVTESFARKHWPDGSALGSLISTHNAAYREMEIVGVVADVHSLGPATPPPPMLYVPYQGDPRGTQGMYVKVSGDPMSYAGAVGDAIWSVDSSQPIAAVAPMSSYVNMWVAVPRAARDLVVALATLALLLSGVGVFGVVSYAVRTRRSELGVRLALGATSVQLERDQLRTVLPVVLTGVGLGGLAGVLAARGARSLLFEVSPLDPLAVLGALLIMSGAAFLATYLPTRRVGRIDPTEAMRVE